MGPGVGCVGKKMAETEKEIELEGRKKKGEGR